MNIFAKAVIAILFLHVHLILGKSFDLRTVESRSLRVFPARDLALIESELLSLPEMSFNFQSGLLHTDIVSARFLYTSLSHSFSSYSIDYETQTIQYKMESPLSFELEFFYVLNLLFFPFSGSGRIKFISYTLIII